MEQPGDGDSLRDSEGDLPSQEVLTLEKELMRSTNAERVSSGDAWLYARAAAKVLARLREVAPDLVEAAEYEVGVRRA